MLTSCPLPVALSKQFLQRQQNKYQLLGDTHAFKCNAANQDPSQRFCVIQNCNLHLSAGTHHLQLAGTARISCYRQCSCL